jgi:hypothetical protein
MKLSLSLVILAAALTGAITAPRRLQAREFDVEVLDVRDKLQHSVATTSSNGPLSAKAADHQPQSLAPSPTALEVRDSQSLDAHQQPSSKHSASKKNKKNHHSKRQKKKAAKKKAAKKAAKKAKKAAKKEKKKFASHMQKLHPHSKCFNKHIDTSKSRHCAALLDSKHPHHLLAKHRALKHEHRVAHRIASAQRILKHNPHHEGAKRYLQKKAETHPHLHGHLV